MKHFFAVLACAVALPGIAAEQGSSKLLKSITEAKHISRVAPKYPTAALRNGHEGWVELSYVVEPDGSVSNVFVTDSSGFKHFELSALKAVKQWKFEPAMENGKAVQQCHTEVHMDFAMERKPGVTRKFKSLYDKIQSALQQQDLDAANTLIEELLAKPRSNLFEDALVWEINGNYALYKNDLDAALDNYSKAASAASALEDTEIRLRTLSQLFKLNLNANRLAAASRQYDRIAALPGHEETLKALTPLKQKIDEFIDSDANLQVPLKINDRGFAGYTLARSDFRLANVKGNIDDIEVYCKNKRNQFSYAADSAWHIPASWGTCSVYVRGSKDTAFNIVELPKQI